MSEFETHFRKDLKLLTSDSLFIILLVLLAVISFFMALTSCSNYVYGISNGWSVITQHDIDMAQKNALAQYWGLVGNFFMVVFLAASAMAMSVEKDSGMSRYTLTFKVRKLVFYVSKLLLLVILVGIAMIIALIAYLVVFSFMDVPMLSAGSLLASMLYPALGMLVFVALGLALSTLATKKGAVVALAVVVFLALSAISSVSIDLGSQAAYRAHPTVGSNNMTEFIPIEYKLLIYGNPVVLTHGTGYILNTDSGALFDTAGGILLSVSYFTTLLVIGLLSFSRERQEQSWVSVARGWRKHA
jgi:ABC-type transport system involved in multi-copper enzyme maturation permease subunit